MKSLTAATHKTRLRFCALLILSAVWVPAFADALRFDIPAQPLFEALKVYADQAKMQLLYKPDVVSTATSNAVIGDFDKRAALELLLRGTGLEVVFSKGNAATVRPIAGASVSAAEEEPVDSVLRLAQSGPAQNANAAMAPDDATSSAPDAPPNSAENKDQEIVVTGTLIRGAQSASPLTVVDREYIEKSGYSTLYQVLQSLPQNYGGGNTEATKYVPGGSQGNVNFGSSVNLRGIGSGATLTLIDGHRLAPTAYGQFVDISLIPLSAVERIEVLADGASATYGSDAIGGVVNVILRKDYEGAQTHLKFGNVTSGDMSEYHAGQTFGKSWVSGNALVTYEYFRRGNLDATERSYAAGTSGRQDLMPAQKSQSVLLSAHQALSDRVQLHGTAMAGKRDAERWATYSFPPEDETSTNKQASIALGADAQIANSWQAALSGLYAHDRTEVGGSPTFKPSYDVRSIDAKIDGTLFQLPGGGAKVAFGASARREGYVNRSGAEASKDRRVTAAFGEFFVPLVGADNALPGVRRLEATVAGRHEKYSDFGTTTDPKFGLLWSPAEGLNLRGTYGTSFRAPTFFELNERNVGTILFELPDPQAADGTTLTLWFTGNNAGLQPEEATTWTAGFDIEPSALSGGKLSLTYFNTRYTGRIVEPASGSEILAIYTNEDLYASLIARNPSVETVNAMIAAYTFYNFHGPFAPEDVGGTFDQRLQNLSSEDVSGLDFSAAYPFVTALGEWSVQLASTYLFELADRLTAAAPVNDVVGKVYHPADLKVRGSGSWTRERWGASAILNYIDGFTNATVSPAVAVSSWTTLDLQLTYEVGAGSMSWLQGVDLALNIRNALDKDPPYLSSPLTLFNVGYDPTNADPLGRFISLGVTKKW